MVGRDLWRSSGLTPLLKQSHLEQVVQNYIQAAFEYLPGWRHHNLPGQPGPVLGHSHSKEVFSAVPCGPSVILVLSLGATEKSLAALSFHPPSLKAVVHIREIHLLFSVLNHACSLSSFEGEVL